MPSSVREIGLAGLAAGDSAGAGEATSVGCGAFFGVAAGDPKSMESNDKTSSSAIISDFKSETLLWTKRKSKSH